MQLSSSVSLPVQEKEENGCIGPATTSNEAVVAPNSEIKFKLCPLLCLANQY